MSLLLKMDHISLKCKGIQSEKVNEKTRVDVIKVKTNTTYNVVASVIKGRGAKSEVIERSFRECG